MLAWLKKWWWTIVAGIATVIGVVIGASLRKKPVIIRENPERKDAEADAAEQAKDAAEERDETQQDAKDQHADDVKQLVEKQKEQAEELLDDPEDTNAYLKQTGKDVRRP